MRIKKKLHNALVKNRLGRGSSKSALVHILPLFNPAMRVLGNEKAGIIFASGFLPSVIITALHF